MNHRITWRVVRLIILGLLLSTMTLVAPSAVPSAFAAPLIPAASLVNADGTLNTHAGISGSLDLRGWNVTLDSARGPILLPDTSAPAAPKAVVWSALANNGLSNSVQSLAVSGTDLYVGGHFTQTKDGAVTNLNRIAKYSGGVWSALAHNGLYNMVYALGVVGTDLYVGGDFTQTQDGAVTLNYIAKYSGGAWSALAHNGLNVYDSSVYTLAVSGTDLYVGGNFLQTADGAVTNLNRIAKYNTSTSMWSALPNTGLNGNVFALAVSGTDVYVGGIFTQTQDGAVTNLNRIAKYNTSTSMWSALAHNGLSNSVQSLAVNGTDLYVGGDFTQTADGAVTNLNRIAKYNTSTSTWSALPNTGLNAIVYALAVSGTDLYVGGGFSQTADGAVTLNRIAKYSGGAWSALPNTGLNNSVHALVVSGTDLYVGGLFTQTADGTVNLNGIARLQVLVDTTTVVSCVPNPSTVGQTVTCTATITKSNPATPSGTMTFKDGTTTLCTVTVAGNTVQCATSGLAAGSHSITAAYSGDATFAASTSSAFAQAVNVATTTTLAGLSGNFAAPQAFTFTATVAGGNTSAPARAPTQTGTVTFYDNNVTIPSCANVALGGGVATCTVTLGAGTHVIRAHYNGDATFAASDSTTTLTLVIAQPVTVNVAPREVPEGDTLFLLGGGMSGLGVWLRWQWGKRRKVR